MRSATSRFGLKMVLAALLIGVLGCGQPTGPAKITASTPPPPATAVVETPADEQAVSPMPDVTENAQAATETPVSEGNAAGTEVVVEATTQTEVTEGEAQEVEVQGERLAHPFPRQVETPEFSKQLVWLNSEPLTKADLKGKFVLFDFWTYCCINCIHILPELKKLEQTFPNNLVVIGVHSAKFQTEKDTDNIRNAVMRYEIEHPVINDADHSLWNAWGINSWPSIILIDPEGNAGRWSRLLRRRCRIIDSKKR